MTYKYKNKLEVREVIILFKSEQSIVCEVIYSDKIKIGLELRYCRSYFDINYEVA